MLKSLKKLVQKDELPPARSDHSAYSSLLEPVSRKFGFDRGTPIDRYYIEKFLAANSRDIRGRVLEIADSAYTKKFGGNVTQADVLHAVEGNKQATIIGDLATGAGVPRDTFDCIIATQLFQFIYDFHAAIKTSFSVLKPNGVLLATLSGISQISRYDMDRWGEFWRFTTASAQRSFEAQFGQGNVTVESHGNVLAACAFLRGLAIEEMNLSDLDHRDDDYQLLITVRAVKRSSA